MKQIYFFLIVILAIFISGCASTECEPECQPVLFPLFEYGYKATPYKLPGEFTPNKDNEIIEHHELKIEVPKDWGHEIPFGDTLYLFSPDKTRKMIISYERPLSFGPGSFSDMHLVGCKNFKPGKIEESKTAKDFIRDLYLFTEEEFENPEFQPTFWHYFILWTKFEKFKNVENMVHYQGINVEAFRRDEKSDSLITRVTLFHRKFEPHFFSIGTTFDDDDFVNNFVDMIDVLN